MNIIVLVREATSDSGRPFATAAQSRDEEIMNSITHGLGLVLSIAGLSALVTLAEYIGTTRYTVGCGVYGASLVMLYAASTMYHSWPAGELKRVFHLLDHIGIYVLIAGTYTPMALFAARGTLPWSSLAAAWGFALIGSCENRPHEPARRRLFDAVLGDGRYVRDVGPAARGEHSFGRDHVAAGRRSLLSGRGDLLLQR